MSDHVSLTNRKLNNNNNNEMRRSRRELEETYNNKNNNDDDEEKCATSYLLNRMTSHYDNCVDGGGGGGSGVETNKITTARKGGGREKASSLLNGLSVTLNYIGATLMRKNTQNASWPPPINKHKYYMDVKHERRPRLVKKCGELNIDVESVPKRKRRLLSDFFNTVLDVKWRWHIFIFIMTFLISWFLFASVWYLIGKP